MVPEGDCRGRTGLPLSGLRSTGIAGGRDGGGNSRSAATTGRGNGSAPDGGSADHGAPRSCRCGSRDRRDADDRAPAPAGNVAIAGFVRADPGTGQFTFSTSAAVTPTGSTIFSPESTACDPKT